MMHFISVTLFATPSRVEESKRRKVFFTKEIFKILKNVEFSFFLVTPMIFGIGSALIERFLSFILEEIHAPKMVIGMIAVAASLSEVLIYPFFSRIKKLVGGSYPCFIAAVFSF